jgi:hypothetical protein
VGLSGREDDGGCSTFGMLPVVLVAVDLISEGAQGSGTSAFPESWCMAYCVWHMPGGKKAWRNKQGTEREYGGDGVEV